jgi:scyllo-inositol 2-dehydrogenase (NADP+)
MRQVSAGLAGYGVSGAIFHAPLIQSVGQLHLAAIMTSRREQAARDLPGVRVVSEFEELCNDPGIDLIVVATPTSTHFGLARAALSAGKHVVVDKPFTVTVEEAGALIAIAESKKLVLSVFQNRRWDNDYLTVKRQISEGRLGTIYSYEAHYDRFRPNLKGGWREEAGPGSGILYDLGAHMIDQALQLFGMPECLTADVFRQRRHAVADDYFHLILEYGVRRVILHASMIVREPGPRYAVHGDGGSFLKYGIDPQEDALRAGKRPGDPDWGVDPAETAGILTIADGSRTNVVSETGAWQIFYEGIAAAILNGNPVPVKPEEARDVISIIQTAHSSAGEKRTICLSH